MIIKFNSHPFIQG